MEYLKDFSYIELSEVLIILRRMIKKEVKDSEIYKDLRVEIMDIERDLKSRVELLGVTYRNGAYSGDYNPSKLSIWWCRFKLIFK